MLRRVAILLAAVLAFAGCSGGTRLAAGFGNGNSVHTLDVDGAGRSYRLYKPVGLPSSAPLVVMLHGGFGSAKQAERSYGWDELADSEKFLVAYPDGYHRAWNANGGGCCGRPAREGVDDIGFVRAVVADIANNVSIDPARVYVTGMSNGAIMSYTLACNTSIFAAIGVVSGTQLDPCQSPRPVSVIHIHGTADPLVRYHGRARRRVRAHRRSAGARSQCVLARGQPVRRAGYHDRRSGHHIGRHMRRQSPCRAAHRR